MNYDLGDEIELLITDQGDGISCFGKSSDGLAVFVDGKCVPGDTVRANITQVQSNLLRAELKAVLDPAPGKIEPSCSHFHSCGGCKWQQLPYEQELALKHKRVTDAIHRIGKTADVDVLPILGAEQTSGYRNKLTFTRDAEGTIGYHLPGDPHQLLLIEQCPLGDAVMNALLNACRDLEFHKLVIRKSEIQGKYQVLLDGVPQQIEGFPVTTKMHIEEKLLRFTYRISTEAFFQVNTRQAEQLVTEALRMAAPKPNDKILELFCGLGTFSLPFAARSKKLVGFEGSKAAVKDASTNARLNHLSNCQFHAANLNKADALFFKRKMGYTPDLVLTDPPRTGMAESLCEVLRGISAPQLVYVSCNPATLARDAERLSPAYALKEVRPIDLFPRTEHVECVARLERV